MPYMPFTVANGQMQDDLGTRFYQVRANSRCHTPTLMKRHQAPQTPSNRPTVGQRRALTSPHSGSHHRPTHASQTYPKSMDFPYRVICRASVFSSETAKLKVWSHAGVADFSVALDSAPCLPSVTTAWAAAALLSTARSMVTSTSLVPILTEALSGEPATGSLHVSLVSFLALGLGLCHRLGRSLLPFRSIFSCRPLGSLPTSPCAS